MIARSERIRRQLGKNVSLHFEVDNFSHCLLEISEIDFIDEGEILGSLVVPENYNRRSLLKSSKNKVATGLQVVAVCIVETVHALLS